MHLKPQYVNYSTATKVSNNGRQMRGQKGRLRSGEKDLLSRNKLTQGKNWERLLRNTLEGRQ